MSPRTAWTALVIFSVTGHGHAMAQQAKSVSVEDFAWIAGTWEGSGPSDFEGVSHATSIWTAPVEGVMSWTFRWHTPENGHVHFAFTVLEDTNSGVVSRGIHHGRDFERYEEARWLYRVTAATEKRVSFECVEHCRAKSLTLELAADGSLTETYETLDPTKPLSVFRYRRAR